jgi:5-methylcytosine-specific restriction endonuclease McrA
MDETSISELSLQDAKRAEKLAKKRAARLRHRDKINAATRAKRAANPEGNWAYQKQWRDKNIEKVRAQSRAKTARYQAKHPEKVLANNRATKAKRKALTGSTANPGAKAYRVRKQSVLSAQFKCYRAQHLAREKARYKAWAQANPEKVRANGAKRRARLANAPINDFTKAAWRALCKATGYCCAYCDTTFPFEALQQDHITPLSKGGSHTLSNIVPACKSCNSRKRDKDIPTSVQPFLLVEDAAAD